MTKSKTSNDAKNSWQSRNYDRITVLVKKGEKEKLKELAEKSGIKMNRLILHAINHQYPGLLTPIEDTSKEPKNKQS